MFICAAGDIHGAINQLYEDVLAFEVTLGAGAVGFSERVQQFDHHRLPPRVARQP